MIKKTGLWALIIILILTIGGIAILGFWPIKKESTEKFKAAATIFPLCDLTRQATGSAAEVVCLMPPGVSPHTFEASPRTIASLEGVDIIFYIGYGVDDWILDYVESTEARMIRVDSGIELKLFAEEADEEDKRQEEGHNHDHEPGRVDPHYWLSAPNAEKISRNIYEEMKKIDPKNEASYDQNWVVAEQALAKLDGEIRLNLSNLRTRKMVTMHEAWGYFAEAYDLEVAATFEPFPGKEPTPKYLADLSETMKKQRMTIIFSEPQLSNEILAPFVEDLGLRVYMLDPLGGVPGRESYVGMMEYNSATIKGALGK